MWSQDHSGCFMDKLIMLQLKLLQHVLGVFTPLLRILAQVGMVSNELVEITPATLDQVCLTVHAVLLLGEAVSWALHKSAIVKSHVCWGTLRGCAHRA